MSEENKLSLDENGEIKINDEFLDEVAGGSNPDDQDDECMFSCNNGNCNCQVD